MRLSLLLTLAFVLLMAPVAANERLAALTENGVVSMMHLSEIVGGMGTTSNEPGFDERLDLNEDGIISLFDLIIVAINFGRDFGEETTQDPPDEPPVEDPQSTVWFEHHWDFANTQEMITGVHSVRQTHGGVVELLANQPGGLTTTGNVMRGIYPQPTSGEAHAGVDIMPTRALIDKPQEVWIENMIRFDENWHIQSDDKTWYLLEDHSDIGGENEVWPWRTTIRDTTWFTSSSGRISVCFSDNPPIIWDGEWRAMRHHLRMPSGPDTCDGIARLWIDEELIIDGVGLCSRSPAPQDTFFRNIALGRNADPAPSGIRDWGRVRVWLENPGWSTQDPWPTRCVHN